MNACTQYCFKFTVTPASIAWWQAWIAAKEAHDGYEWEKREDLPCTPPAPFPTLPNWEPNDDDGEEDIDNWEEDPRQLRITLNQTENEPTVTITADDDSQYAGAVLAQAYLRLFAPECEITFDWITVTDRSVPDALDAGTQVVTATEIWSYDLYMLRRLIDNERTYIAKHTELTIEECNGWFYDSQLLTDLEQEQTDGSKNPG
jgi:hypothetical protein